MNTTLDRNARYTADDCRAFAHHYMTRAMSYSLTDERFAIIDAHLAVEFFAAERIARNAGVVTMFRDLAGYLVVNGRYAS